jgi:hypothetical protein
MLPRSSPIDGRPLSQPRRAEYRSRITHLRGVPDDFLQVIALRQVLRAALMAKSSVQSKRRKGQIQDAIDAFLETIVVEHHMPSKAEAFALARDVLEHFDDYYCGTGNLQKKDWQRSPGIDREDLAQRYRVDLAGPSAPAGWPSAAGAGPGRDRPG